jgi:hypothetical protein
MKTIDKIITKVGDSRGTKIGRSNVLPQSYTLVNPGKLFIVIGDKSQKVFDCAVPMSRDGEYDKGGAYWGFGTQLRVRYTRDFSFIQFYRKGN